MAPLDEIKIYSGQWTGVLFVMIGAAAAGCGTALWFVAEDPLLAIVLMGLPAWFLGAVALFAGIAALKARIEISRGSLRVVAPQWRGCPMPPARKIHVTWDAIRSVRHRTEVYCLLPGDGLPFPVDAYAIDTDQSRVVVAGKSIPHLEQAIRDIARRTGRTVQEDPSVRAGILRSLVKGPPPWQ